MAKNTGPLISAIELLSIADEKKIILLDARSGPGAKDNYQKEHLRGAQRIDLEADLAKVPADASRGGRHPLPTPQEFLTTLRRLGIEISSIVIIYDDKHGANAAARAWWMLLAAGVKNVKVLDGGYQAALAAGFPVTSEMPATLSSSFEFTNWQLQVADMDEAGAAALDKGFEVIDVREPQRYDGIYEPIDLIAGHIPGAINIPYYSNLSPDGRFLTGEELRKKYEDISSRLPKDNIIVHCGSGVTACHTLLAFAAAGLDIPKLYAGSWSEWSRNDKPIATTD